MNYFFVNIFFVRHYSIDMMIEPNYDRSNIMIDYQIIWTFLFLGIEKVSL